MKRKIMLSVMTAALLLSNGITALAAPEVINVGGVNTVFDADYYASANPDVMAAFGTNRDLLVQHYTMFGISENRAAYAPDTDVNVINALLEAANTAPVQQTVVTSGQKKKLKSKIENWAGSITTTEYTYDESGNMLPKLEVYSDGGPTTYTYTYDAQGNVLTGTDDYSTYTYTHDAQGKILKKVMSDNNEYYDDWTRTYTYTYDAQGNVVTEIEDDSSEGANTYAYTYDAYGNVSTRTTYSVYGMIFTDTYTYTYDEQGNPLTGAKINDAGETVATYTYTYY